MGGGWELGLLGADHPGVPLQGAFLPAKYALAYPKFSTAYPGYGRAGLKGTQDSEAHAWTAVNSAVGRVSSFLKPNGEQFPGDLRWMVVIPVTSGRGLTTLTREDTSRLADGKEAGCF